MLTKSEFQTEIITKEYFLPEYTYPSIKLKDNNKNEFELCDCLIDIGSLYVTIQIKEREQTATSDDQKWFEKKVLKNAKKQLFDSFNYIKNSNNYKFYSNDKQIIIDSNKEIMPIIVFDNENLTEYKKIIYSSKLNKHINIFSLSDFKTMLNTVIIPYDILKYCEYRLQLFYNGPLKRLLIDHIDNFATIIGKPQSEADLSEFYIARTYYQHNINIEYIKFYNVLLKTLSNKCTNNLILQLVQTDTMTAYEFVKKWQMIVENWITIKDYKLHPFKFKTNDNLILLIPKPIDANEDMFHNYYLGIVVYNSYKFSCQKIHSLIFTKVFDDNYSVDYHYIDINEIVNYDEILLNSKKLFEN